MTEWHEYPSLLLQLNALTKARDDLRAHNLYESYGMRPADDLGQPTEEVRRARQPDGTWNDLADPHMGAKGTGFGRNVPLSMTVTDVKRLLKPDPRVISRKLMARDDFKPAGIINALAAAWLQFENHNWFFHGDGVPDTWFAGSTPSLLKSSLQTAFSNIASAASAGSASSSASRSIRPRNAMSRT